jgi:hypothetical protein
MRTIELRLVTPPPPPQCPLPQPPAPSLPFPFPSPSLCCSEYDDSLITKLFVFQFINSYSSFYFLAFIAPYLPRPPQLSDDGVEANYVGECGSDDCMVPLSINLGIIFFMNLTVNNLIEASLPFLLNWNNKRTETQGPSLPSPPLTSLIFPAAAAVVRR